MAPSPSARWTAAQRARLARTRPATPGGDLEGEERLYRDVAGSTAALPTGRTGDLRLRTRVVDRELAQAIGRGVEQAVLIGAGYDGRALRFANDTVHWFEVDSATLLADKRRRLSALGHVPSGVAYVGIDLESDDPACGLDALGAALAAAGHDPARPSLFTCESVLPSLTLAATATLCITLRACAALGSELVATFAVAPEAAGPVRALRTASSTVSRALGDGRLDELRPGDPEKLMVVTGWHVTHTEHGADRLLDRGMHQLVLVCEPDVPAPT